MKTINELKLADAARSVWYRLIENAIQSTLYVAGGRVLKRDICEKFGITEEEAEKMLYKVSSIITADIRAIIRPDKF